ncbi:tetratricopeptide repeat-containing sensor histidine kinase [Reichenbachiella ulvae]|uniref:histidine kinase n=1 Tax=Reichenbachiella ulvae TaxID=2980104 RepID=A0ABT3CVJ3_9BACT|nr:sensor histidine kinase [Reichenbachiella ulvae]MCV9387622.1 sensor histidine kinase [Reichenbachiella ulvae]
MKRELISKWAIGLVVVLISMVSRVEALPYDLPRMVESLVDSFIESSKQEGVHSDSSLLLLDSAFRLSQKVSYKAGMAKTAFQKGEVYLTTGQGQKAVKAFVLSKEVYELLGNPHGLMMSYKQLGSTFRFLGDLVASLDNYSKGLEIAELEGFVEQEIRISNNIGTIHFEQDHYEMARDYYFKCLKLEPSDFIKAVVLGNLGMLESKREAYDKSLGYFKQSLELQRKNEDWDGFTYTMGMIASLYLNMGKLDKALEYEKEALRSLQKKEAWPLLLVSYNKLGLIYFEMGQYDSARVNHKKSRAIAEQINSDDLLFIIANLAFNEAGAGRYQQAYDYLFQHLQMKDSLFTLEKNYQIEELLAKYEAEKKEKEISMLQSEQALNDAVIEKEKLIRNVAVFGSALLLILVVVVIQNYSQKLKNKEILTQKNEEINQRTIQEILKEGEIQNIRSSLEGQENERKRIARELHDGVAGTLAGIKLQLNQLKGQQTGIEELIQEVDSTYNEVRTLSHDLSTTKVLNAPFVYLLRDFVESRSSALEGLEIKFIASRDLSLNYLPDQYKIDMYRVLQELVSNVMKHSRASYAEVALTQNEEEINMMVEDNGRGFDRSRRLNGIGLDNIKQRVKVLNGRLHIDSQIGRGTIVSVDWPLPQPLNTKEPNAMMT